MILCDSCSQPCLVGSDFSGCIYHPLILHCYQPDAEQKNKKPKTKNFVPHTILKNTVINPI